MIAPDRLNGLKILVFGMAGGVLLKIMGMPAGLFMGCMVFSGFFRIMTREPVAWLDHYHHFGQILIGIFIGASFRQEIFLTLKLALLPIIVQIVVLVATGVVLGIILSRWTILDTSTSILSSLPGGLPVMVGLAADLNHNASVVAVVHFFRLTVIVLTMPILLPFLSSFARDSIYQQPFVQSIEWSGIALLILIGVISHFITRKYHFPGGDMLVPLFITGTVNLSIFEFGELHFRYKEVAITLLSISIGARITRETIMLLKKVILPAVTIVIVLVFTGLILGLVLYWYTPIDLVTALLSSVPGGAASLTAVAGDLGADMHIVVSLHLCRLLMLTLIMPPVFLLFEKYRG